MSKTAMIIGATGMTGQRLLNILDASEIYERIYLIHYRTTNLKYSSKVQEITVDFDVLDSLKIKDHIDTTFCCIGTTMKKAGTIEKFRKVDLEYVQKLGDWCKENGTDKLLVISSTGANKDSGNLYLRTKGEMEHYLQSLDLKGLVIVRPPLLYGEKRPDFRWKEVLGKLLLIPIGWFVLNARPMKIKDLAQKLFKLGIIENTGTYILNPKELHLLK